MTVENKKTEINDFKEKLSKALDQIEILKNDLKVQHSFSCQTCDYKASTDIDLEEHMKIKHEPMCNLCDLNFKTIESLEKHTCKQNIDNAEFNQFYTKNWMLSHGCSAVFNKHQQKEIANKKCWNHVCPCRELPAWHNLGQGDSLGDEHGILHAERNKFIEDGVVHWSALCKEF